MVRCLKQNRYKLKNTSIFRYYVKWANPIVKPNWRRSCQRQNATWVNVGFGEGGLRL